MGSPSFPFRNPVAGDGDPPEWTPPSYAKESEEEWKPPEYASVIKEEKKSSKFSNLINSLKPAERIHPGEGPKARIDRFISDVLSTDKHPETKRILISSNPSEESLFPTTHEAGIKEPSTWIGGFTKGLYDEFVRPLASPVGAAMGLAFGKSGPLHSEVPKVSEELPIRQNIEIPPKIEDTPQIEPKIEELPIKQPREALQLSDIPPEANKQMVEQTLKEGKEAGVPDNPIAQKLEAERQAIEEKPKFVNPFEKSKIEEPQTTADENWKPPEYAEESIEKEDIPKLVQDEDGIVEMSGGLGGIKSSNRPLNPSSGPYGAALDKLFSSMGDIKEARVKQDVINKIERAQRFAEFSDVKDEGVLGASKQLSALKGEFDKVDLDKLKMTQPQVDSLFTAVKRAKITEGEKARGYTALFKLFNGEGVPQRNELRILDDVFGNEFADRITEMHGGLGSVGLNISKIANTMKSMQNAISLAAPLRHGIGLVARKEFYPAFTDMFKFFGNKEFYNNAMQAIEDRPNHMLGREAGLFLSKPNSLMSSEEEFLNSYVGDIPGVKTAVGASQRAYTGFLNKLRADTFDSMIKQMKGLGYKEATQVGNQLIPTKETEAIARYINNATGRGSLGSLNKMTNELNLLLWSPRMISSRINMLANPKIYTDLPKGMRLDGLKSLLGIAALGTAIDTLSAYAGAKVSSNILSTDYGKSRFGTSLIDPWGGFQQYIVAAARFLAGKTDSSQPTNRAEIAGRFLANKESPAASLAHELLTAKFTGKSDDPLTAGNMTTQYGQKTNIYSEISKRFIPIFVQDIMNLAKTNTDWSENIGLNSALGLASLAGMSQSYPEKKQKGQLKLSNSNKLSLR